MRDTARSVDRESRRSRAYERTSWEGFQSAFDRIAGSRRVCGFRAFTDIVLDGASSHDEIVATGTVEQ
jgi:hypothetical protein